MEVILVVEEEDEEQVTIQAFNPASIRGWRDEVEDATSPTRVVATAGTVAMTATGIIIPSSMATAVEVVDSERAMARTVAVEIGTLDDRVMDLITEVSSRSGRHPGPTMASTPGQQELLLVRVIIRLEGSLVDSRSRPGSCLVASRSRLGSCPVDSQ